MAKLSVEVRLMNLAGRSDALCELEVGFLDQLLPLFQVQDGAPRAHVDVVRVGTRQRLLDYLFYGDVDIIHLATHGQKSSMQVGDLSSLRYTDLKRYAVNEDAKIQALVLNTSCEMASPRWVDAFLDAGALAYIATKRAIWAKDAAIFASAFYSAYFGTVHKKRSELQRAFDSYRLAHAAYASFVPNASRSRFYFYSRPEPKGRRNLEHIRLV